MKTTSGNTRNAMQRDASSKKTQADRGDVSLFPLDPETAIRAIMEAGPHPTEKARKNRARKRVLRSKRQDT